MKLKLTWIILIALALAACNGGPSPSDGPTLTPTPATPTLTPEPSQTPTPTSTPEPPKPEDAARDFLDAWVREDYPAMYALTTSASQAAITLDDFKNHFRGIAIEAALKNFEVEFLSIEGDAQQARASYRVTMHSNLVPDVVDETGMTLQMENGEWRVVWDDTIVFSYIGGTNYISMTRDGYTPARGEILDRNGKVLAGETEVYAIGLNMAAYDPLFSEDLVTNLARLDGTSGDGVLFRINFALANALPYLSFGEYSARRGATWVNILGDFPGIEWNSYISRFYYDGPYTGIAPHIVGYVGPIDAARLDEYRRLGYRSDELIGQSGLEQWGESYLLGKRGGLLSLRDGNHQAIQTLAETVPVASQNITTTFNIKFQEEVQAALSEFPGAAVVLERDTGRVLAMASYPTFNPNAFNPTSINSYNELVDLNDPLRPLYSRTVQGVYPLGSVFKIITMAAALESGVFTPESTYDCGYAFTDVPGITLYDWTWNHYLEDGETLPSGLLTLPQALVRSCNPFYYHMGQKLYEAGKPNAIADMARAFGLGSPTGILGLSELPGNVPNPTGIEDAMLLAIGQSQLQVTPLQVASFVAAVGNGGILFTPQVIEQIGPGPDGLPSYQFAPQERGTLPLKPENLALIQEAMGDVVYSKTPRGTAYLVFNGYRLPIFGKTGTAQTGADPHSWFVAYTDVGNPSQPDIAVAVVMENRGEGSEWAAPVARRIIDWYFRGGPGKLYPWESSYGVHATPEPPADSSGIVP